MKHALIPSLVLALMLSACGGGGSSGSSSSKDNDKNIEKPKEAEGEKPKEDKDKKPIETIEKPLLVSKTQTIGYYGDSTVRGYETFTGDDVARPAPMVFKENLPGSQIVINKGQSGQTACGLIEGKIKEERLFPTWEDELNSPIGKTFSVVIVNHGINEAVVSESEFSPAKYENCLKSVADIAETAGKHVIFETPNPIGNEKNGQLSVLVEVMKKVAMEKNLGIIDQHKYLTGYVAENQISDPWPDTLHPTQDIYEVKGKYAAERYLTMREK